MKDSIWIMCYILLVVAGIFEVVKWVINSDGNVWFSFWLSLFATIGGAILQVWYFVQCSTFEADDEWVHVVIQFLMAVACIIFEVVSIVYVFNGDMDLGDYRHYFDAGLECNDFEEAVNKLDDVIDEMKNGYVTTDNGKLQLSLENLSEDVEFLKNNTAEIMDKVKSPEKSCKRKSFCCLKWKILSVAAVVFPLVAVSCAVVFAVI